MARKKEPIPLKELYPHVEKLETSQQIELRVFIDNLFEAKSKEAHETISKAKEELELINKK